jgi:hypothetical protein
MNEDVAEFGAVLFLVGFVLGSIRFLAWFLTNLGSMETIVIPIALVVAGFIALVVAVSGDDIA